MHGARKAEGINVNEAKIGITLGEINPQAQTNKQNFASHSLNPKVCNAKYLNDKIHYDRNEKLGMFGVAHVCARDGFCSKIVGYAIDCNVSAFLRVRFLQKMIEMIPLK